jgi:hypothetical protein
MLSRLKRGLCKRSSWSMSIDAEAAQPSAELLQEIGELGRRSSIGLNLASREQDSGASEEEAMRPRLWQPPALLALATVLQAYAGVCDDEVIEATVIDRRWQLVLDCLDCEQTPFSKGTLVAFRQRLIEKDMDRPLTERVVALAQREKGFGRRQLRAPLDSSPLWGAGRVEDTYNLMGRALRKALSAIARQRGLAEISREAGAAAWCGRWL